MKKLKLIILPIVLLHIICSNMNAQILDNTYKCYFKVGNPCPDFTFNDVVNFPKKQISLKNFKGKWLILDFWNKGCSSCIASFPKIYKEQQEFKDNIQFLLVGQQDKEGQIQPLYQRLKKSMGFELPCVFDSVYLKQVNELAHGFPFVVVIDPEGIVRGSGPSLKSDIAPTYGILPSGVDLTALTTTSGPMLHDIYREKNIDQTKQYIYDPQKDYLINNNGGPDSIFLFRSILAKWNKLYGGYEKLLDNPNYVPDNVSRFLMSGVNIPYLYMMAFTGRRDIGTKDSLYHSFWPWPIVEVSDTTIRKGWYWQDTDTKKYIYSVDIKDKKFSRSKLMQVMQNDLNNYLGYNVSFEERKMHCWSLIIKDKTKVKRSVENGAPPVYKAHGSREGFVATDMPMERLISILAYAAHIDHPNVLASVLFDDTGINKIDLDIHFTPNDFESIRQGLQQNGLDIVPCERTMKVLVIRDPKK